MELQTQGLRSRQPGPLAPLHTQPLGPVPAPCLLLTQTPGGPCHPGGTQVAFPASAPPQLLWTFGV